MEEDNVPGILKAALRKVDEIKGSIPKQVANFAIKQTTDGKVEFSVNCIEPRAAARFFKAFKRELEKEKVI